MNTTIVHCKREEYDVYIGRSSKWGNPFKIGDHGDRDEVIQKYEEWLLGTCEAPKGERRPSLDELKRELKGKVLGCWCKPKPCHGDVLARLANAGSGFGDGGWG